MLDLVEIERLIVEHGGIERHEVKYSICFYLPKLKQYLYINKQAGGQYSGLALHPRYRLRREELLRIDGVHSASVLNHKSSYRKFPKRLHGGQQEIPYGIPFGFDSESSFNQFMKKLEKISPAYLNDPEEEISNAEVGDEFEKLSSTEKKAVVNSRRGQGRFRDSLIDYWGKCSVTECESIPLLRASHIKPWRDSTNIERLDKYNGFLLVPNLDVLFDVGLISFSDDRKILISSSLDKATLDTLGVNSSLKLYRIDANHKRYLKYHRSSVFQS